MGACSLSCQSVQVQFTFLYFKISHFKSTFYHENVDGFPLSNNKKYMLNQLLSEGLNWQWTDLSPGVLYMLQSCSEAGIKASVGRKPDLSGPKWDDTGLSVLFEKRMLHLWLVALCVHVVMWSSIRPSSHRYHGSSATHAQWLFIVSGPRRVGIHFGVSAFVLVDGSFGYFLLCFFSYYLFYQLWPKRILDPLRETHELIYGTNIQMMHMSMEHNV